MQVQIKIQTRLFFILLMVHVKLFFGLRAIELRTVSRAICSRLKFFVLHSFNSCKYLALMLCHHIRFTAWIFAVTSERKLTWRTAIKVRWNHLRSTDRDLTAFLEADHTYSLYSETGALLK